MLRDTYRTRNYRPVELDRQQPLMIQQVHSCRYDTTLAVELYHLLAFHAQFVPIKILIFLLI